MKSGKFCHSSQLLFWENLYPWTGKTLSGKPTRKGELELIFPKATLKYQADRGHEKPRFKISLGMKVIFHFLYKNSVKDKNGKESSVARGLQRKNSKSRPHRIIFLNLSSMFYNSVLARNSVTKWINVCPYVLLFLLNLNFILWLQYP